MKGGVSLAVKGCRVWADFRPMRKICEHLQKADRENAHHDEFLAPRKFKRHNDWDRKDEYQHVGYDDDTDRTNVSVVFSVTELFCGRRRDERCIYPPYLAVLAKRKLDGWIPSCL